MMMQLMKLTMKMTMMKRREWQASIVHDQRPMKWQKRPQQHNRAQSIYRNPKRENNAEKAVPDFAWKRRDTFDVEFITFLCFLMQ